MADRLSVRIEAEIGPLTGALAQATKEASAFGVSGAAAVSGVEAKLGLLAVTANKTKMSLREVADASLGIGKQGRGFQEAKTDVEAYGKSLDAMREKYNPLFAVGAQYRREIAGISEAVKVGAIVETEAFEAKARASQRAMTQMAALNKASEADVAASTGRLRDYQRSNLRSQAIDIGTMASMGASPLMIASSQGGQIYEALASGNGVRANVKAVGGEIAAAGMQVVRFLGPAGLVISGLTAVTAAAVYFGDKTEENLKKVDEAAKSYSKTLQDIGRGQPGLIESTNAVLDRELRMSPSQRATSQQLEIKAQVDAIKAAKSLIRDIDPVDVDWMPNVINDYQNLYRVISGQTASSDLRLIGVQLQENTISATEAQTQLKKMSLDPKLPTYLADANKEMLAFVESIMDAEAKIKAFDQAAIERQRAYALGGISSAQNDMSRFLPDTRTERQEIEAAARSRLAYVDKLPSSDRGVAEGMRLTISNDLNRALGELTRQEQNVTAARDLSIRSIFAQTAAERASIASQQMSIDLDSVEGDKLGELERQRRIAAEATKVFAEATMSANEALRQSTIARAEAGLQGYAAGLAAINAQYAEEIRLATGSAEAVSDLQRARSLDVETLQTQTRKGLYDPLQDRLAQARMEASLLGQSEDARRRANDALEAETLLKRAGIDASSKLAEIYKRDTAALSDFEEQTRRTADAIGSLKDVGESAIDGFAESLTTGDFAGAFENIASDLTKTLTALAISNPLKNSLLGTNYSTISDLFANPKAPQIEVPGLQSFGTVAMNAGIVNLTGMNLGGAAGAIAQNFGLGADAPITRSDLTRLGSGGPLPETAALSRTMSDLSGGMAGDSIKAQVANYFAEKGLARHQIAGVMGNISAESAFNPLAVGDAGQAFGLFQHNDRKGSLFNAIGGRGNLGDVKGQLDFAWKELQTTESAAMKQLLSSTDVRGATAAFAGFERPRGYTTANPEGAHNFSGRLSAAEEAYAQLDVTSQKLKDSASAFQTNFDKTLNADLAGGLDSIANTAVPLIGDIFAKMASSLNASGAGGMSGWTDFLSSAITGGMTGAPGGGDGWAGLRSVTAATGGLIRGPGTGTSDSIPAWLSDGEYVINARSASRHRSLLDDINNDNIRRYAAGGHVAAFAPRLPSNVIPMTSGGRGEAGPSINLGSVSVVVQGNADEKTLVQMQKMLKQNQKDTLRAVQANIGGYIKEGRTRGSVRG